MQCQGYFQYNIFLKITGFKLDYFTDNAKKLLMDRFDKQYYLTYVSKILTHKTWDSMNKIIQPDEFIFINSRLNGGFDPFRLRILAFA